MRVHETLVQLQSNITIIIWLGAERLPVPAIQNGYNSPAPQHHYHSHVSRDHPLPVTVPPPLSQGCEDHWSWNKNDKSHEVIFLEQQTRMTNSIKEINGITKKYDVCHYVTNDLVNHFIVKLLICPWKFIILGGGWTTVSPLLSKEKFPLIT